MYLIKHPQSGNWFLAPDSWDLNDVEGYDEGKGIIVDTSNRESLILLTQTLNRQENIIFNLLFSLKEIKKIVEGRIL